jgi:hypothetical protein
MPRCGAPRFASLVHPQRQGRAYLVAVATIGAGDMSLLICGRGATNVLPAAPLTRTKSIAHTNPFSGQLTETVWLGRARMLALIGTA